VVLKCAFHDHKAYQQIPASPFIPVTRRVKGYTRFVGKYVTGRRNLFRPHKVLIFLNRRISAEISETIRARILGFGIPVIPVTRRVKGYTRFVGKYVTGIRNLFRPHKVYIFFIRITSRVNIAMSVCLSVGWTLRSRKLYELGYWDLACRFLSFLRTASLFQQGATPTLTHTIRPKLWLPQFRC